MKKRMIMIATITLNPSIDQHLIVPDLHKDDTNRASSVFHYPGGKGANVSKVVRELGGRTHAYAMIGGFTGKYWNHLIRKLDIPFTTCAVEGETRINTLVSDIKDKTQTRISAPGPKVSEQSLSQFLKLLLNVSSRPHFWALGGSLPLGLKASSYRSIIEALQKKGARCVLDTDGEALKEGVKAKPFMIKPNEYEIERLIGYPIKNISGYLGAAKSLNEKGIALVVVSMAARGALFVTKTESFHVTTPAVKVRSKIGAGDSLIGGLLLGLERGKSLKDAARLGVAASTSAVMREAPRLCLASDIKGSGLLSKINSRDV